MIIVENCYWGICPKSPNSSYFIQAKINPLKVLGKGTKIMQTQQDFDGVQNRVCKIVS